MKMYYTGNDRNSSIDYRAVETRDGFTYYQDRTLQCTPHDTRIDFYRCSMHKLDETAIDMALVAAESIFNARAYCWDDGDDDTKISVYPYMDYLEANVYQFEGNLVRFMHFDTVVGYGVIDDTGHMTIQERCNVGEVTNSKLFLEMSEGRMLLQPVNIHSYAYMLRNAAINVSQTNQRPIHIGSCYMRYHCPRLMSSLGNSKLATAIYEPNCGVTDGQVYVFDDHTGGRVVLGYAYCGYIFAAVDFSNLLVYPNKITDALLRIGNDALMRHGISTCSSEDGKILLSNDLQIGVVTDRGTLVFNESYWNNLIPQLPLIVEVIK